MPIVQNGSLNLTALVVADTYVNIIPPSTANLNGVPTNVGGYVGTASWGPVNVATGVSDYSSFARAFGPLINRTNDVGTEVSKAILQGANAFQVVRVTDGTDTKASATILSNCLTINSLYSGSYGNNTTAVTSAGSKLGTFKIVINLPGIISETFDNIAGTGAALWANMAAAINGGTSLRGPSQLVTAVAGSGTTAPTVGTAYPLIGGTDGASTITSATLVGVDGTPRTGMYALRNQGCSILVLSDMLDSTQWTTIQAFAQTEGMYAMVSGPSGDNIANAISVKSAAGLDSYALKVCFGDWIYWNDPVNQVTRLVNPTGFFAGRLQNLSPEQSSLNKPIYGIVGTQRSTIGAANGTYSEYEIQQLELAGIDVITNPSPGGTYWSARVGHNSSSSATINGDNYTRMTNYIASTLAAGMGVYIGQTITPSLYNSVNATLNAFNKNLFGQNMIAAWSVQCNPANNPESQTSLGYLTAAVNVQYLAINEKFIIDLTAGISVTIASQQNTPTFDAQNNNSVG